MAADKLLDRAGLYVEILESKLGNNNKSTYWIRINRSNIQTS
jgi:hypothetical protein